MILPNANQVKIVVAAEVGMNFDRVWLETLEPQKFCVKIISSKASH